MTQQERILNLAHEKIAYFGTRGARQWGKSLDQAMTIAINFTINNLWISVDESLPKEYESVLIRAVNKRTLYVVHDVAAIYNGTWNRNMEDYTITHWMPIPALPEGGAQ